MTNDQHRMIGNLLGFPECCVDAWVEGLHQPTALLAETGLVVARERTPVEARILDTMISRLIGFPEWSGCSSDPRVAWVACEDCWRSLDPTVSELTKGEIRLDSASRSCTMSLSTPAA